MACHLRFERRLWKKGVSLVAGIDEAGRGPLAGPVVAAAAILPVGFSVVGVDDSKQLAETVREELFDALMAPGTLLCYGVGMAEAAEIDRLNILQATYQAMRRAFAALPVQPEHVLVDGLPVPAFPRPQTALVGGDGRSLSIAVASIIAKVTRDRIMRNWHSEFPRYDFYHNKGYGTPAHLESLQTHGPCSIHRRSFEPVAQTYFPFH